MSEAICAKLNQRFAMVACKVVDRNKREICCGCCQNSYTFVDRATFNEAQKRCNEDVLCQFREALADKIPSWCFKSLEEVKGVLDAMIALEGYSLEWFYCGWEEKDENNA